MALAFDTDGGNGPSVRLGVIVLQSDETLENELRQIFRDPAIACYHSRIPSAEVVTEETLKAMEAHLPAAAVLLPKAAGLQAIAYACTSGATLIGPERVSAAIRECHKDACTTDPLTAVIAAMKALNAKKVGFLTPYRPEISLKMQKMLEKCNLEIAAFGSYEREEEQVVARISEQSTLDSLKLLAGQAQCDVLFASCTNLRTLSIIEAAEAATGLPVISSNSALAWHMLKLAGYRGGVPGFGRLLANIG